MKYALVRGQDKVVGLCQREAEAKAAAQAMGLRVVEAFPLTENTPIEDLFVDVQGRVRERMPKPSRFHRWNRELELWEDPRTAEQVADEKWTLVRQKRQELLRDSDWVVTRATEEGGPVPKEWRDYRKALRDITLQTDPDAIVWPIPPST